MQKSWCLILTIFFVVFCGAGPVLAETVVRDGSDGATTTHTAEAGSGGTTAPTAKDGAGAAGSKDSKNDGENYLGDRLTFPVNVNVVRLDNNYNDVPDGDVCVPAATSLRGLGKVNDKGLIVTLSTFLQKVDSCSSVAASGKGGVPAESVKLTKGVAYRVRRDVIDNMPPDRFGLTYGGLVVPYKYHFSGSKSFKGGASVGPYLGYRFDKNYYGFGVKLVGFCGLTAIEVSRTVNGESQSDTLAGLSYGIGILGTIKNEFQFGLVVGADKVSKDSDYEDNNKLWGAIALGFSFTN